MTITVDVLRGKTPDELQTVVNDLDARLLELHQNADGSYRDKSAAEDAEFGAILAVRDEAAKIAGQARRALSQFQRGTGLESTFGVHRSARRLGELRHPLDYTRESLDAIQDAIVNRSAGTFRADDDEIRAALATGTYGAPRVWGSNVLAGPRVLHVAAGVPQQPAAAIFAQLPVLTLPSATTSVGENVTLTEFAASTAGSVTLARFGRWTDLSSESLLGADAGALVSMHRIGIAKDLDNNLIGLVNTAAGSAVAFTADVPAAIRGAMAKVIDATAAADSTQLQVLCHPDNAALLQSVTPVGGRTIGEGFQDFSGALVYPSSAVPTGFMLVANLAAGVRYFEARPLLTETQLLPKVDTLTLATSVIAGYGIALGGSAFVKVDVVTP
jgi:hypothetical protein